MKLNRSYNQRKALFKTQLNALITYGKITTTESKAKNIKRLFDSLVVKAKVGSVHARRQLAASLSSVSSANKLVDVVAPLFTDRNSGFTSITKDKVRKGDGTVISTVKLMAELPRPVVVQKEKKAKVEDKKAPVKKETKVKSKTSKQK